MGVVSSGDHEGDEVKCPRSRQLLSSEPSSCFPGGPEECVEPMPMTATATLTHSSVSRADSSPNLGEQPEIQFVSDMVFAPANSSSPKLGEVARRAGGVCRTHANDRDSHPDTLLSQPS